MLRPACRCREADQDEARQVTQRTLLRLDLLALTLAATERLNLAGAPAGPQRPGSLVPRQPPIALRLGSVVFTRPRCRPSATWWPIADKTDEAQIYLSRAIFTISSRPGFCTRKRSCR